MADAYLPLRGNDDDRRAPFLPLGEFNASSGDLRDHHHDHDGGRTWRLNSDGIFPNLFTRRRCSLLRVRALREFKPRYFKCYHAGVCALQAAFALAVAYSPGDTIVPRPRDHAVAGTFAALGALQCVNVCAAAFFLLVVVAQMRRLTRGDSGGGIALTPRHDLVEWRGPVGGSGGVTPAGE